MLVVCRDRISARQLGGDAAQSLAQLGRVEHLARPIFGGAGNLDEIGFPTRGWSGMTIRLLAPDAGRWSLYWVSSRRDTVDPPVIGRFADGRGEFYGDDAYEGRPIRVRYVWSDISETTARWEQAFSVDGEQTWETNWVMRFRRA